MINHAPHIDYTGPAIRLLATIGMLFLLSCDLFEPRSPEEPTDARGRFIPPTTAEIVIENFINAINERNTQHYVQCFADPTHTDIPFEFIPTQEAQRLFAGLFTEWTVRDERTYFDNVIASVPQSGAFNVILIDGRFESQSAAEATYIASYRLTAQHANDAYPHYVFEGTLRFEMTTDDNSNWVISRWADLAGTDTRSWSELKGNFRP